MKKILLLAVALLAVTAGNAQMKRSGKALNVNAPVTTELQKPKATVAEAQINDRVMMADRGPKVLAPKDNVKAWYNRPAGVFYFRHVVMDGAYVGVYPFYTVLMKPYSEYTWANASEGAESYLWQWETYFQDENEQWYQDFAESTDENLVTYYSMEFDTIPILTASGRDGSNVYSLYNNKNTVSALGTKTTTYGSYVASVATAQQSFGDDERLFGCSHFTGIRNTTEEYSGTYYRGATPHGDNQYGWWFGKNDTGIDAICQLYEQPEHPYALKSVAVDAAEVEVPDEGGHLTMNIYKLNAEQPQYLADQPAMLDEADLELISTNTVEVDTTLAADGFIIFPIIDYDEGLPFETSLHVNFPILIEITGFNGAHHVEDGVLVTEDTDILNFSGVITTDNIPEGFGECAFLKYYNWRVRTGTDASGNPVFEYLDEPYYTYEGLCNFFTDGADMMQGFEIYVEVEYPFLVFNYNAEDGEYEFPVEGGSFSKTFGTFETDAISIYSWEPSDVWTIMTPEGEDVPDWLTLEPTDIYEMDEESGEEEFTGLVDVSAVAEPLPEGMSGRECTVLFTYPGAELTYHFIQGDPNQPTLLKGDVNRDGKVNVSDVTALINMILGVITKDEESADVNKDGKINVSDVTALVNIILGTSAE